MRSGRLLIFVFNCDRGNLSALRDFSQTQAGDRSRGCQLLSLVSSPVGIKKSWKRFVQTLGIPEKYLHRDEYEEEFGALLMPLPAIFLHDHKTRILFITADEIGRVGTAEELMALVRQKLGILRLAHDRE